MTVATKEMNEENLRFAQTMATNRDVRDAFLSKLQEKKSFRKALDEIRDSHIMHIERSMGFPLRPEDRAERDAAFILCTAYLFAGLCSLNDQEIPEISPDLIAETRTQCDSEDVLLARHNVLSRPGIFNETWAAIFVKLYSAHSLTSYGRGLLYALAMAWIKAVEEENAQRAQSQDVAKRTEALRTESPVLWKELGEILEAKGFGDEPLSGAT